MSLTIDEAYPARLNIDFPDRKLDRMATFLRLVYAIPVVILLSFIGGVALGNAGDGGRMGAVAGGVLVMPVLLMVLFRQKYPRWWFDFNLELTRFSTRVMSYLALMSDRYPSTDEEQSVHLELDYPNAKEELNRWLPLVKWVLAIPHYVVLIFLGIAAFFAVIFAWLSILFTGRYPRGIVEFVEGVFRWGLRVNAYAFLLVTDRYPPFRMASGE
ncbi:MAG TPA: DUF4389 domain-containing protein [Actinomycetota bacterium]|nr:DUF4389 domain-containing protein [Actinomycetota bacterium]